MIIKRFLILVLLCPLFVFGQHTIDVNAGLLKAPIGNLVETFFDSSSSFTPQTITNIQPGRFKLMPKKVSSFLETYNNVWVRFSIKNSTQDNLYLHVDYANIPSVKFYKIDSSGTLTLMQETGTKYAFASRKTPSTGFIFPLSVSPGNVGTYYVHFTSEHPLQLPLSLNNEESLSQVSQKEILIIGLYSGLILSILLYNIFLFFSTRDNSYFFYVLYLFALLFALLTFSGWSFKFLWPNHPGMNMYAVLITSTLPGITALIFGLSFLQIKKFSRSIERIFYVLMALYMVPLVAEFFYKLSFSYTLLSINGIIGGILLIVASGYIAWRGYRPAYYYFVAWFVFAVGRLIQSFRNLDVLPYNNFTTYILYIGSSIEAIMLSLALADRINIYKKEKEQSQLEALNISKENERLVRDQNIVLEQKVTERTNELSDANLQLNSTLVNLKDAQAQLVDAEKMASLGQLTAGIAHEINNPINFVKSNINPLKLDMKDIFDLIQRYDNLHKLNGDNNIYKQELQKIYDLQQQLDVDFIKNEVQHLIKGIEDGAERTAEIVRGLRTFSRLDESELKIVNVHDGIDSTIVLIRNTIPFDVQVIKVFKAKGMVECYPGKLNQVFMNIITNGLQAINSKPKRNNPESITITTRDIGIDKIEISIKDTGIGMSDDVKHRVFEPFFTTKDVGEGTGLGMAIVFKIMEKHHGKIDIVSSPGNGADFIITLPYVQPIT